MRPAGATGTTLRRLAALRTGEALTLTAAIGRLVALDNSGIKSEVHDLAGERLVDFGPRVLQGGISAVRERDGRHLLAMRRLEQGTAASDHSGVHDVIEPLTVDSSQRAAVRALLEAGSTLTLLSGEDAALGDQQNIDALRREVLTQLLLERDTNSSLQCTQHQYVHKRDIYPLCIHVGGGGGGSSRHCTHCTLFTHHLPSPSISDGDATPQLPPPPFFTVGPHLCAQ